RRKESRTSVGAAGALGQALVEEWTYVPDPLRFIYRFHGEGGSWEEEPVIWTADRSDFSQALRLPGCRPFPSARVTRTAGCDLFHLRRYSAVSAPFRIRTFS